MSPAPNIPNRPTFAAFFVADIFDKSVDWQIGHLGIFR